MPAVNGNYRKNKLILTTCRVKWRIWASEGFDALPFRIEPYERMCTLNRSVRDALFWGSLSLCWGTFATSSFWTEYNAERWVQMRLRAAVSERGTERKRGLHGRYVPFDLSASSSGSACMLPCTRLIALWQGLETEVFLAITLNKRRMCVSEWRFGRAALWCGVLHPVFY